MKDNTMDSPDDPIADFESLLDEIISADYPGDLTDLDIARYLCKLMKGGERAKFESVMRQYPKFAAEIRGRQTEHEEMFSPERLDAYAAGISAALGFERPAPSRPQPHSISLGNWLQETLDRISADVTKAFNEVTVGLFGVLGTGATSDTLEVPTDKVVVVVETVANESKVRILAEIEDLALEGKAIVAIWGTEQASAILKRPTERSTIVTGEILMENEQARSARKQGIHLKLTNPQSTDNFE